MSILYVIKKNKTDFNLITLETLYSYVYECICIIHPLHYDSMVYNILIIRDTYLMINGLH